MQKQTDGYEKFTGICFYILSVVFFPRIFRHFRKFVPVRAQNFSCDRHCLIQQQAKGHASGAGKISISVLTFWNQYNLSKKPPKIYNYQWIMTGFFLSKIMFFSGRSYWKVATYFIQKKKKSVQYRIFSALVKNSLLCECFFGRIYHEDCKLISDKKISHKV